MGTSASTGTSMLVCRLADSEEPPAALRIGVERGSGTRHLLQVCTNLHIESTMEVFSFAVGFWFPHELHGYGGETNDSGVSMNQSGGAGGSQNHGDGDLSLDHSGSYNEADMLNFLDKWLEPWGPGRRLETVMLDAYAPHLTDTVHRMCWQRGFIPIAHGGGATMVCQPNDTNIHAHLRKHFIEKQTQH